MLSNEYTIIHQLKACYAVLLQKMTGKNHKNPPKKAFSSHIFTIKHNTDDTASLQSKSLKFLIVLQPSTIYIHKLISLPITCFTEIPKTLKNQFCSRIQAAMPF